MSMDLTLLQRFYLVYLSISDLIDCWTQVKNNTNMAHGTHSKVTMTAKWG